MILIGGYCRRRSTTARCIPSVRYSSSRARPSGPAEVGQGYRRESAVARFLHGTALRRAGPGRTIRIYRALSVLLSVGCWFGSAEVKDVEMPRLRVGRSIRHGGAGQMVRAAMDEPHTPRATSPGKDTGAGSSRASEVVHRVCVP